jgi:hypothetical protein
MIPHPYGDAQPGTVIEVDRLVSANGLIGLAGRRHPVGVRFAGRRLTVRLELEELRLLTNADMASHSPFASLLVGQPTLRRRIKLGTFAALDQRIAITGRTDQETSSYVSHHLTMAGRSDTLFSDDALALIHQVSRGLLNCQLCIETPPAKRVAAAFAELADAI